MLRQARAAREGKTGRRRMKGRSSTAPTALRKVTAGLKACQRTHVSLDVIAKKKEIKKWVPNRALSCFWPVTVCLSVLISNYLTLIGLILWLLQRSWMRNLRFAPRAADVSRDGKGKRTW